jgi:hypothetical protein
MSFDVDVRAVLASSCSDHHESSCADGDGAASGHGGGFLSRFAGYRRRKEEAEGGSSVGRGMKEGVGKGRARGGGTHW